MILKRAQLLALISILSMTSIALLALWADLKSPLTTVTPSTTGEPSESRPKSHTQSSFIMPPDVECTSTNLVWLAPSTVVMCYSLPKTTSTDRLVGLSKQNQPCQIYSRLGPETPTQE